MSRLSGKILTNKNFILKFKHQSDDTCNYNLQVCFLLIVKSS